LLNEPGWLSTEAVVEMNRAVVAITGEPHLLRDQGLLKSALARPRNFFGFGEEDIVVLAASLMAEIARAHAFAQGNKRTCFVGMVQLLKINRYDLASKSPGRGPKRSSLLSSIGRARRISCAQFALSSSPTSDPHKWLAPNVAGR
jgi:death-on-curing protein